MCKSMKLATYSPLLLCEAVSAYCRTWKSVCIMARKMPREPNIGTLQSGYQAGELRRSAHSCLSEWGFLLDV